ncbi:MAG: UDP-N-acetylmuramate dehydrogenase [Clostridia bacterium]|nr:UDP-N-acetylmuramate dehydrogenase [Clostridia bacterium]
MRYKYLDISRHTTIGIGSIAKTYYPQIDELSEVEGLPLLANGSNTLVNDTHPHVLYTLSHLRGYEVEEDIVVALAGQSLSSLSYELSMLGYSGLEWAIGIPGSVGGAIYMNAGAFSLDISSVLVGADVYRDGKVRYYPLDLLGLGYRSSNFEGVVVRGYFRLERLDMENIYASIDRYRTIRASTQPRQRSMGSTFKRVDGMSAGRIIDELGLKGYRIGDAMVSPVHAGFVVNVGRATYLDVRHLIDDIKEKVLRSTHLILQEEIKYLD